MQLNPVFWSLAWADSMRFADRISRDSYYRFRVSFDALRLMWRVDRTDRPAPCERLVEPCS